MDPNQFPRKIKSTIKGGGQSGQGDYPRVSPGISYPYSEEAQAKQVTPRKYIRPIYGKDQAKNPANPYKSPNEGYPEEIASSKANPYAPPMKESARTIKKEKEGKVNPQREPREGLKDYPKNISSDSDPTPPFGMPRPKL